MKVYEHPSEYRKSGFTVVTSGTFDGVHLAHQKILARVRELATENNGEIVLITFWPHPRHILYPEEPLFLINSFDEKAELLQAAGVDHLVKIPFTKEFSNWSSDRFIRDILMRDIGTDLLVIGFNHRFGKNREGSFEHLHKNQQVYGFRVEEIDRQQIDDINISSTNIRKALETGDMQLANTLMGHPYSLRGHVVQGDKIGRDLGYPTANIQTDYAQKLIPSDGVYAVEAKLPGELHKGMMYIGTRPTLNKLNRVLEVNLFDFDRDIYNLNMDIRMIGKIRGDLKFDGLDELKEQISKDKVAAERLLKQYAAKP